MKLFIAGSENIAVRRENFFWSPKYPEPYLKPIYLLHSYFNVRTLPKVVEQSIAGTKEVLLDSGAFTFMTSQKNMQVDFISYAKDYADFIKYYHIPHYFELDIDAISSYQNVLELRAILEREVGYPPIPVWHTSRGAKEFEKMCQNYPYVAIGGIVTGEILPSRLPALRLFADLAHKYGCQIHGLGCFRPDLKINFDSVDCTSFNTSYAPHLHKFNGTKIVYSKRPKGQMTRKNMSFPLIAKNANEWVKCQIALDK